MRCKPYIWISQESQRNIPMFCGWADSGRWAHGIKIFYESLSIEVFPPVELVRELNSEHDLANVPKVEDDTRTTEAAPQETKKPKKSKPFMLYEKKKTFSVTFISAGKVGNIRTII